MDISTIKKALFKEATIFQTGGFQPTEAIRESWIGKVLWGKEPNNEANFEPIATLFLKDLPYIPQQLVHYELLTVHMDFEVFDHMEKDNLAPFFKIQCFSSMDDLQKVNEQSKHMKAFPLKPLFIQNDAPTWEDIENVSPAIEEEILRLEDEEGIEYFDDIVEEIYAKHKFGGYPSFTQGGMAFGEDYPFVFQIASDEKAEFNIVDSGNFYFFYNKEQQDWIVYCDFY